MPGEELTLENLKSQFMYQFKDEYLFGFFEMIYDKYEEELLKKFDQFYKKLIKSFKPAKQNEIAKDLFEIDFMTNICENLNLLFLIAKLNFEHIVIEKGETPSVALVSFNNQEEKAYKENLLEKDSEEKSIEYYIIYVDLNLVRSIIESLMLMPTTIISMTQSTTDSLSDKYEAKIKSLQNYNKSLKKDADHGKSFKGKALSDENKRMYVDILTIQKELSDEHGSGHGSSLTQSVRVYSQRNKCHWNELKIKSIAETIRILKGKGKI